MSENKLDLIKGSISLESDMAEKKSSVSDSVNSYMGDAIQNDSDINTIDSQDKPEVSVLIGFPECGKTSFVASLYHIAISTGMIGKWQCYDSDTFVGFERRLFLRRYNTNYASSGTLRTIRGDAHILTLKLINNEVEKCILLSDHSGEDYADYANNPRKIASDALLRHCDRIIILVDSCVLISRKNLSMKNQFENLLTGMKNAGVLNKKKELLIIFNKRDVISESETEIYSQRKTEFTDLLMNTCGIKANKIFDIQANNVEDRNLNDCISHISESVKSVSEYNKAELNKLNWVNKILNRESL